MKEEILINLTPRESRAALVENGVLQEVQIERASRRGLISNIYKGQVSRVLPGMQAAFVEVGLERTAFLHASDIARNPDEDAPDREAEPNIRDCVQAGDELLVQVLKDPIGTKGARLTTYISIPSTSTKSKLHSLSGSSRDSRPHRRSCTGTASPISTVQS